jgi:hypothetical protein
MKCFSCRRAGTPGWPWRADDICCSDSTGEVAYADVAQWLRTRAIRVAWLIGARRHIPGLTVDRS